MPDNLARAIQQDAEGRAYSCCTGSDMSLLLNFAVAAPYGDISNGVFAALDSVFAVAPLLRERWHRGGWEVLDAVRRHYRVKSFDRRVRGLLRSALAEDGAIVLDPVDALGVLSTASAEAANRVGAHKPPLREVLAVAAVLARAHAGHRLSREAWFQHLASVVTDSYVLAPEHPVIDRDPALWRMQAALAESTTPRQFAVGLHLCAAAVGARYGATSFGQPDPSHVLAAVVDHFGGMGFAPRFTDLIGCPTTVAVVSTRERCQECTNPADYRITARTGRSVFHCSGHVSQTARALGRGQGERLMTLDQTLPYIRSVLPQG